MLGGDVWFVGLVIVNDAWRLLLRMRRASGCVAMALGCVS